MTLLPAGPSPRSLLVVLFCAGLAVALSLVLRGDTVRAAAPAMFLLVVITVVQYFNRWAGLAVALLGCLVFAGLLFEPYGSFAIYNTADRIILLCFILGAAAAVCLSPNLNTNQRHAKSEQGKVEVRGETS